MMKCLATFAFVACFQISVSTAAVDVETIRKSYASAVTDKQLCEAMLKELKSKDQEAVFLAYLGGFQSIWANHVFSPITKLSTFKKGKTNIEKAVRNAPLSIEVRFVRLSIQKNIPFILNYRANIQEDEAFLRKNYKEISSVVLRKMVDELLVQKK